jgi:hypothetical protein
MAGPSSSHAFMEFKISEAGNEVLDGATMGNVVQVKIVILMMISPN